MVYGILVSPPGIKPGPLAMSVWSPNHWTAREFPKILLNKQKCTWLTDMSHMYMCTFGLNILKLCILLVWKKTSGRCYSEFLLGFPFTLETITIFQDLLLMGRYLSRLSSTSPSSLHRRVHLFTEAFTNLILMSHGGRGLTGNQDKQKSVIQAPQLEIAL